MLGPKLVDQNPNKLWYYPLMANWYRCGQRCNTFEDSSDDIYIYIYITTTINESKSLIKHISCNSKCRFDGK